MSRCPHFPEPSVSVLRCMPCGEYLPLGPANDTPAVQVEVRAATLATMSAGWWNDPEWESCSYGVLCYQNGGTPGDDSDGGSSEFADDEWAGWLACAIRDRKGPPRPRSPLEMLVDKACGYLPETEEAS